MASRTITTARQERLGTELRKLRERAGLTARQASKALGIDPTRLSHTEAGRVGVSPERVRRMATFYACPDPAFVDALADMTVPWRGGWWEEYRDLLHGAFLDLAELEHYASFLRTSEFTHIPGILQTEDHARAVFAYAVPELPANELDLRVEFRMRRRIVLERESPVELEALIHESALRTRVADRKIARAQLEYLVEVSQRPGITIRVIPFDIDGFAGAGYSMLIAGGPVPQLDTVHLDSPLTSGFVDADSQVSRFRGVFHNVERSSLGTVESRDFIHRIAQEL